MNLRDILQFKGQPPTTKNSLGQYSSIAEVENPQHRQRHSLEKSDHIPHQYGNVKMCGVIQKKKKIPLQRAI